MNKYIQLEHFLFLFVNKVEIHKVIASALEPNSGTTYKKYFWLEEVFHARYI
jgi:hypothetical protein